MRKLSTIYLLAASLFISFFCSSNLLHSQDEKRIAGYLNKFKRGEYKEKLDSCIRASNHKNTSLKSYTKFVYFSDFNDSSFTVQLKLYQAYGKADWDYFESRIIMFDTLGRIKLKESRTKNGGEKPITKIVYEYYKSTYSLSTIYSYAWSDEIDNLILVRKDEYFYDSTKSDRLDSIKTVNQDNTYQRLYYTYDNSNNVSSILSIDSARFNVITISKTDYQLDNQNRIVSSTQYKEQNAQRLFLTKNTVTYSAKLDNVDILQIWDSTNNIWKDVSKETKNYNSLGKLLNNEEFRSYDNDSFWRPTLKTENFYNNENQLIKTIDANNWSFDSKSWIEINEVDKVYDEKGNLLNSQSYSHHLNDSNRRRTSYSYDTNKDTSNVFAFIFNAIDPYLQFYPERHNKLLFLSHFVESNNIWFDNMITTFYYSPVIYTSVENKETDIHSLIYPNPANTEISIESKDLINSIEIYDMLGNLKQSHSNFSQNDNKLDIQSLTSGVYVVKIIGSNFTKNELLTIQR